MKFNYMYMYIGFQSTYRCMYTRKDKLSIVIMLEII